MSRSTKPGRTTCSDWHPVLWLLLPALGAPLGWLLRQCLSWLIGLPWLPFQGPMKLLAALPEPRITIIAVVLGAGAGLAFGYFWVRDSVRISVGQQNVTLRAGTTPATTVERSEVSAVFCADKELVLLDEDGDELARQPRGVSARRLQTVFTSYGYPWVDADPYRDQFRRWVPDTPDLSTGVNALLAARQRALRKSDHDDLRDLRTELAREGVVVREQGERQYWRFRSTPRDAGKTGPGKLDVSDQ